MPQATDRAHSRAIDRARARNAPFLAPATGVPADAILTEGGSALHTESGSAILFD